MKVEGVEKRKIIEGLFEKLGKKNLGKEGI
jgi:hypothetical protein